MTALHVIGTTLATIYVIGALVWLVISFDPPK